MRKLALPLLVLVLASLASAQLLPCNSSTHLDTNGNPCTIFTTIGGYVVNGNPVSYSLATQDGVVNNSPYSEGVFNLDAYGPSTLMPIDPLFTLNDTVVDPWHWPPSALNLNSGTLTNFQRINGPTKTNKCTYPAPATYTLVFTWVAGVETIDPPDVNGNNTYTWSGTLSVPFTFAYCISGSGRGGGYHTSPVYTVGTGTGELSAVASVQ